MDLRTFGPNHGTGFYLKDVNDRQYFLRCEKGEDINTQIDEYRDDLFQQLADKFQTASNVDQATISQVGMPKIKDCEKKDRQKFVLSFFVFH